MVRQQTRRPRARRPAHRPLFRFRWSAPTLRVDLGSALAAAWAGVRATGRYMRRILAAPRVRTYAWSDAPVRTLLVGRRGGGVPRLFVREDARVGAIVGNLTTTGKPRCDDWRECVGWDALGLKYGEPDVTVLATAVGPDTNGAELERLAATGLSKLDGGAP